MLEPRDNVLKKDERQSIGLRNSVSKTTPVVGEYSS